MQRDKGAGVATSVAGSEEIDGGGERELEKEQSIFWPSSSYISMSEGQVERT